MRVRFRKKYPGTLELPIVESQFAFFEKVLRTQFRTPLKYARTLGR
jgi:hypothetical protein